MFFVIFSYESVIEDGDYMKTLNIFANTCVAGTDRIHSTKILFGHLLNSLFLIKRL